MSGLTFGIQGEEHSDMIRPTFGDDAVPPFPWD
jgi:hypothetical protein